jgi:hypothetical protein
MTRRKETPRSHNDIPRGRMYAILHTSLGFGKRGGWAAALNFHVGLRNRVELAVVGGVIFGGRL